MSIATGQFGHRESNRPYVEIDGIPFPLVPGSLLDAAPLNPFSPSDQAGNSKQVVSQRHAVRVWDDFTGGIGALDDDEEATNFAYGNLDVRQPGQMVLPPHPGSAGTPHGYALTSAPVSADLMVGASGDYRFICWVRGSQGALVKSIKGTSISPVALTNANEQVRGFVQAQGAGWLLTYDAVGLASRMYEIQLSGAGSAVTITLRTTDAATERAGLTYFDNKIVCWSKTLDSFRQYDVPTFSWQAYITGYIPLVATTVTGGEVVSQLFVWTDKSGSKDALYALTTSRIMVYDEDGQQWEKLYDFSRLWYAPYAWCHVNARDNSLVFAPLTGDTILIFNPGTVDSIAANKKNGLPRDVSFSGGSLFSHMMFSPRFFASGIHWLFAFCYGGAAGTVTDIGGGVFAFNQFGGWTQVFDPKLANGGTFTAVLGGGYGLGHLLVLTADGKWYDVPVLDEDASHPMPYYSYHQGAQYYLQAGRVYNHQRNTYKLASHFEVTFKDVPAATSDVRLDYSLNTGSGIQAGWVTGSNLVVPGPSGARKVRIDVPVAVCVYLYLNWKLRMQDSAGTTTPVVESVALYYTFWQENHFAYSGNIDLTAETWDEEYPSGEFMGYTREYLQNALLTIIDQQQFHSFTYSQNFFTESVARADIIMGRRESTDDGSGIYSFTVRDLDA